jgi:2-C-methyl-D-erythritol 4-phosphate cytidylyltransferase
MVGVAIVVAAGRGRRMGGGELPKQYLDLGGAPILQRTLEAVGAASEVGAIVLVAPRGDVVFCCDELVAKAALAKVKRVVAGGASRQASVAAGLEAIEQLGLQPDVVAVHDGVRPFVEAAVIDRTMRAAANFGAAVAATPVAETIKAITDDGFVRTTPDRRHLVRAHTPQAFAYYTLVEAHRRAAADDFTGTDDCQLVERVGGRIVIVEDSDRNIKITTPTDLIFARALWKELHK